MQAREITGLNYLLPSDPCPYPGHYSMVQNTIPTFELHKLSNQFYGLQNPAKVLADFNSQMQYGTYRIQYQGNSPKRVYTTPHLGNHAVFVEATQSCTVTPPLRDQPWGHKEFPTR